MRYIFILLILSSCAPQITKRDFMTLVAAHNHLVSRVDKLAATPTPVVKK